MIVGVCKVALSLPGNRSLKQKRRLLRPLLEALRRKHGAAAAEVDYQNIPDRAAVGFALVGSDARNINSRLDVILQNIETLVEGRIIDQGYEILHF